MDSTKPLFPGDHYTKRVPRAISTPIHMDNVACHGTEDKLINCTYHTDTSEDSHSEDIWIDCSSSSSINSIESQNSSDMESELDTGIIVAAVALILSIIVVISLVGYIICKKQSKTQQIRLD